MLFKQATFFLFCFVFISFQVAGQNCPSGKKNKKEGTESFSVMLTSNDYYSLIVQKKVSYTDTTVPPKYNLLFNAASRVKFNDSLLATKGTIDLLLANGTTLSIGNVAYTNANMGFGNSLLFTAGVAEDVISSLATSPVETLTVKEILTTSFATRKQKDQPALFACLWKARSKP
jgi:hypothetical protein